ncbi:helix-turn-helix transcriptional regulator [Burkholderia metallica]|uniref:helix-turn-helix transcriptional regulator n=1 Tax=Burkholderia metallica TaxID=488729 RepID=UPI001CF5DCF9|nr:helix-turn-helix transcriptional regulator [Burkholderia metallica]MCA8023447.1 helix-turn-helix transcriptional regulator [Burkholderia metallica]
MFSTFYFPVAAYLGAPEFGIERQRLGKMLFEGEIVAARQFASRWADSSANTLSLRLHADVQLVTGSNEDAEEDYREAQRLGRHGSREEIRVESCRNTAWQALFRHRFNTALACFGRAADEKTISVDRMIEARIGIVCALYELGRANEALNESKELLEWVTYNSEAIEPAWRELLVVLDADISTQLTLRSSATLQDHIYWQSNSISSCVGSNANYDNLVNGDANVKIPILGVRLDYLRQLRDAASTGRHAIDGLMTHVNWARSQNLEKYQRTLRIEIALAMLACDAVQAADVILKPLTGIGHASFPGQQKIEYLYCVAKILQMQGRLHEAQQVYSRYALISMENIREALSSRVPFLERKIRETSQLDDIGARLPARYRRAYNFILENLEHPDLSVSDIAAEIGVTERALQSTFKKFLDMSPTELIRRQRMERIRSELVDGMSPDSNILAVANRWGVQDRSTMTKIYRKQFDETPSHTLKR